MATIIGTASVKVTLDSTGFKQAVETDVGSELQQVGDSEWMEPGLQKNEADAKKSSANISDIFSKMFQGIKVTGLAYLGSLIPAAGNSLVQLSGLLGLIPGIAVAGGTALATLVIGFQGFGQALKDINNQAAFTKDLANLAPSAAQAAGAIQGLTGQFKSLRLDVQQQLFQGLASDIKDIGGQYLPIMKTGLSGVASSLNTFAQQTALFLKFPDTAADFSNAFGDIKVGLGNLVPAWNNVLIVVDDLVSVSTRFLPQLGTSISNVAAKFGTFIDNARNTGQLAGWIQTGIDAFKNLISIVGNVADVILKLFSSLDSTGGNLLGILSNLTGELKAFVNSAAGSQLLGALATILGTIGSTVGPVFLQLLKSVTPLLVNLAPLIKTLGSELTTEIVVALKIIAPLLAIVAKGLTDIKGPLVPLVLAFASLFLIWKAIQPLIAFITFMTVARDALYGLSIAQGIAAVATQAWNAVLDANPIILIGIAVVAVAVLIATHWKQTLAILTDVWNAIKSVAETVWNAISGFFTTVWNAIANTAVTVFNSILSFFVGLWDAVSGFFVTVWNAIATALTTAWKAIVSATKPIWEPIAIIIGDIFTIIKDLCVIFVDGLAIVLIAAWKAISAAVVAIWTPIAAFFTQVWDGVVAITETVWGVISAFLSAAWTVISTVANAIWTPIAAFFASVWAGISGTFTTAWNAISAFLSSAWAGFIGTMHAIFDPIANFFSSVWAGVSGVFQAAWNQISAGVHSAWSAIVSFFSGFGQAIINAIGNVGSILLNAGKAVIEGFLNGLVSAFNDVKQFVGGIASWISSHKGPIQADRELLTPHGAAIMQSLIDGMSSQMPALTSFLGGVSDTIVGGLSATPGAVSLTGSQDISQLAAAGAGGSGALVQINAYQQPGQDVLQFASQVSQIGAQTIASAASTISVSQQPVQIGATNKVVPVGAS
jgi:phage-related protein